MGKLSEVNKYIIAVSITLLIGIGIGFGGTFAYFHYNPNIDTQISTVTVEGKKGVIKHTNWRTKGNSVKFDTISTGKGKITTTVPKNIICSKPLKNSLSFNIYAGIKNVQPTISYGIEYRRQIFTRFHINTGLKIDTGIYNNSQYMVDGFQVLLGAGVNF